MTTRPLLVTVCPFLSATRFLGPAVPGSICCLCIPSAWHRSLHSVTLRDGLQGVVQKERLEIGVELKSKFEWEHSILSIPLMTWSLKAKEQIKTRSDFSLRETLIITRAYFGLGRWKLPHIQNTHKYVHGEKGGWPGYHRIKKSRVSSSLMLKEGELDIYLRNILLSSYYVPGTVLSVVARGE